MTVKAKDLAYRKAEADRVSALILEQANKIGEAFAALCTVVDMERDLPGGVMALEQSLIKAKEAYWWTCSWASDVHDIMAAGAPKHEVTA